MFDKFTPNTTALFGVDIKSHDGARFSTVAFQHEVPGSNLNRQGIFCVKVVCSSHVDSFQVLQLTFLIQIYSFKG